MQKSFTIGSRCNISSSFGFSSPLFSLHLSFFFFFLTTPLQKQEREKKEEELISTCCIISYLYRIKNLPELSVM
jgi:hypothetical protein